MAKPSSASGDPAPSRLLSGNASLPGSGSDHRRDRSATMRHRIVVLGAGYSGAIAAGRLDRRLHPDDTEITVVNADADFVERVRMHQLATGQDLAHRPLRDVYA